MRLSFVCRPVHPPIYLYYSNEEALAHTTPTKFSKHSNLQYSNEGIHNVEANAYMFVRWMLPSMLAQWQVGSLQKFIPAVYCSYYERFKTWYDRSPRIVGIPSVFIICTPTSAPSNIAFNGCIIKRFLHVWITSRSMVSLSLMGSLQIICSKCIGCLNLNLSMDEAPPRNERLQAWYLRAAYKNLFLVCLVTFRPVHPQK